MKTNKKCWIKYDEPALGADTLLVNITFMDMPFVGLFSQVWSKNGF